MMVAASPRKWVPILSGVLLLSGAIAADEPAPTDPQSQYEIRFMEGMIDHHAMAVHMSELCLGMAVHTELLTLCAEIAASQQQEIMAMQQWLHHWYGIDYSPEMMMGMQQRMQRTAELSPEEFEVAFLKSMIRHHWGAVVSATGCIDRAYHPELISLCSDIIAVQTAEIELMRDWLCAWYDLCHYGPKGALLQEEFDGLDGDL